MDGDRDDDDVKLSNDAIHDRRLASEIVEAE